MGYWKRYDEKVNNKNGFFSNTNLAVLNTKYYG
jgi:hypothetical protein